MQADIVTHVQDAVRPGEVCDMYYSNQENSVKQAHPTTVENRYLLDLNAKSFGSANTLIFNPDEGLGHVVLCLQLPAPSGGVNYQGIPAFAESACVLETQRFTISPATRCLLMRLPSARTV